MLKREKKIQSVDKPDASNEKSIILEYVQKPSFIDVVPEKSKIEFDFP